MTALPEYMERPRPVNSKRTWIKENLVKSPLHVLLTLGSFAVLAYVTYHVVLWAFINATWTGNSAGDCARNGACWPFIAARFNQFLYGFYPQDQVWRINLLAAIAALCALDLIIPRLPFKQHVAVFLILIFPFLGFFLLYGGFGLEIVSTPKWGGITLTLVIASVAISVSLPLGTLLALGRRSQMPVVKWLSISFIECMRAVPLISVLFMASVLLPLFLPTQVTVDKLLRAVVGVALFASAYMAEVVRGGLQTIPNGQTEAAKSLGLSMWKVNLLVVLPQALRVSVPGIVNTYIAIFKDTSLVIVIGLFDILGMINAAVNDSKWIGMELEGYVFAAVFYFIFCNGMSRMSRRLEKQFQAGHST
ncbi:amino acid ABC transporter permease [Mesorhizobium sp. A623]